MVYPVRHTIEYKIYNSVENPARSYSSFRNSMMVIKRWKNYNPDTYERLCLECIMRPVQQYNLWVDENGRICTKCNEYKPRSKIAYNKAMCKKCINQRSKQYR